MKNTILSTLLLLFVVSFSTTATAQPVVRTQSGRISGLQEGDVRIFKGVPFAAPPVGELRWRAPQPVQPWEDVRECTAFPPSAMQPNPVPFAMWTQEFITPAEPMSEDCLYLNIWTTAQNAREKRPVFVWIHGGGFLSGSGACPVYDGEEMAKKGVVYVTINYRLGLFGFLAHPELSTESGNSASGNYALLDQIAALKWVKENIAAFGGDPNNVTISGQSAGSMSVNALMASPLAKGLFQRAIAQSGGILSGRISKSLVEAEQSGESFLVKAGVSNIADLRKFSAQELQELAGAMPFGTFAPILDGYVLPTDLTERMRSGNFNDVPLLSGWVTGDGALMGPANTTTPEQFRLEALEQYGPNAKEFLRIFPGGTEEEIKASKTKVAMITFAALTPHLLAQYGKSPVWVYQFSHVPPDKPDFPNYGAFHTSEVPYALNALKHWDRPWQPYDLELAGRMSDAWVRFARTGNPNGPGLPEWKAYKKEEGNIMEFGDKIVLRPGLMKAELDFMDKVMTKQ